MVALAVVEQLVELIDRQLGEPITEDSGDVACGDGHSRMVWLVRGVRRDLDGVLRQGTFGCRRGISECD
ncbi:hypothetical protein GCM10010435_89910 [Winogradskya consettensis]|uniref:Uncharacterized protein n=1 Tax=Winogradskya consettensis TaxID=113560 RepID=A0A919STU6_9ACTN|nr:hypothetical protein Aco04nite_57280 [Actinoplanes consettensis]